jgi:class 3 adenylate cyclase
MSALFAATYPERTAGLVMIGAYAKRIRDATYPWGPTEEQRSGFLDHIREEWGGPVGLEERAPSMTSDPHFRQWWAAYLRTAASPGAAVALTRMNSEADIRGILPAIRVPALVIHRTGDQCLRVEEGRYVASRIPGAKFVELPGVDHLPFVGDQDRILDEIEQFLTGALQTLQPEPVLATVLFASFTGPYRDHMPGANAWQRLRDHVTRELEWFRGRESIGRPQYLLASFDGPARAIRCACAIRHHAIRSGIQMSAGLHIGECEVTSSTVRGAAVETSRRIERQAGPDEIIVTSTIRDLVAGSGISFHRTGTITPEGVTEALPLLLVERRLAAADQPISERVLAVASV